MEDGGGDQQQAARFAELERDIRKINIDGETIELTYHLRKFAELFQRYIVDDRTLSELFTYLNLRALEDGKFAVNMAAVFASRQLDDLVIKETKLRNAMLVILQQNFQNIESLKLEGLGRFYNSITLLGEYYNRKKFANGKRILILGQSLLLLLTTELENEIKKCEECEGYSVDPEFAKVILTQVTLNGGEAKTEHRQEIDDLNYSIRKCLINVGGLSSRAKAYLLMALDLFYTNFNLGQKLLEKLYGKYLFEPDEDTSTKPEEKSSELPKTATTTTTTSVKKEDAPVSNSTSSSKQAPKKPADKTDQSRKQRNSKPATTAATSKPRRKEEPLSPGVTTSSRQPPSTPPKKSPPARARPSLNHTSPRKDQQRQPARTPSTPKSPLQRRTPPEKLKPQPPPPTTPPPPNPSVLKQNCKNNAKNHSTPSPASNNNSTSNSTNSNSSPGSGGGGQAPLKLQMPPSPGTGTGLGHHRGGGGHEVDNVENLAWDDLTLEDESPQKINPHTKSFLTFLAQK